MLALAAFALALGGSAANAGDDPIPVQEPSDYRMDDYLAPVPETLAGASVADTETAQRLWAERDTIFIDVFPQAPKPPNLPKGTIWQDKPRTTIKGALWLANTGYGKLAPGTEAFLRAELDAATGGDKAKPILFFCREDCWMSWNAAKRALAFGHVKVYWYPEGVDGWAFADLETEAVRAKYPPQ